MKRAGFSCAVLTAAALMTLGSAATAFAGEWVAEGTEWRYLENNGTYAADSWETDNGVSYYIGSDGYMLRNTLIEDNENYYYVRSSGAMLVNEWRFLENPEWQGDEWVGEGSWYYFGANGRAVRTTGDKVRIEEIGGKRYAFDQYGRMMTGWISESGEYVTEDNWEEGLYYADPAGNGDLITSNWLLLSVPDADNEEDDYPSYYFYFSSNAKKAMDTERTIGGKDYLFDSRGVTQYGWHQDDDEAQSWRYFGTIEDPYMRTGWFEAIPDENLDSDDYNDGNSRWYYSSSNGRIVTSAFKTIDGKTYAFNSTGERITGLKVITLDGENSKTITGVSSVDYLDDIPQGEDATTNVFYFNSDGTVKTGNVTIDIDGTNYDFSFRSSGSPRGAGVMGIDDNKIYDHGRCLTAEEDTKYQIVSWDDKRYLVNESGTIQKNRKNLKDADGYYYCTNKDGTLLHGPLDDRCEEKH